MASLSVSPADKVLSLLVASFKDLDVVVKSAAADAVSQLELPTAKIAGTNTIASHLSTLIPVFKNAAYTDLETAEIEQWLTLSAASPLPESTLDALNETLKLRTTLLGEKFSVADVAVYARIKDTVAAWTDEQRTGASGRRYVVRWLDFVQNSPELGLQVADKVAVDPSKVLFYVKPEEAPKKEKKPAAAAAAPAEGKKAVVEVREDKKPKDAAAAAAAAAAAGGKKTEKKQKPKREAPPPKAGASPAAAPARA